MRADDDIEIVVKYRLTKKFDSLWLTMHLKNESGEKMFSTSGGGRCYDKYHESGENEQVCMIPANFLNWGNYAVDLMVVLDEGGMLTLNDERFIRRAEIIWEKGTNRAEFFRGEVNKYGWVDVGSSFLPSEVVAAFLWAQIEHLDMIQEKRKMLWNKYYELLSPTAAQGKFGLPNVPSYATNNSHMFYLVCNSLEERTALINKLKTNDIGAVFHYLSLHSSPYYQDKHDGRDLPNCDRFADCLVRLPMFFELTLENVETICKIINQ